MGNEIRMRDERRKQIVEVWKTIIGVQQHFNDIEMRIRGMFVTILLALFASIGFLLDKKPSLSLFHLNVQFATVVPLFGFFGAWLFYFIDRYWYHRLLVGSVKHAIAIEHKYSEQIPELGLSDAIGNESPYKPRGLVRCVASVLVNHDKFRKTGFLHSDGKIELFYKSVMSVLIITTIVIALLGGVSFDKKAVRSAAPVVGKESGLPPSAPAARAETPGQNGKQ